MHSEVYITCLCVCLSVCLSVCYRYSATPGYKAAKERCRRPQCYAISSVSQTCFAAKIELFLFTAKKSGIFVESHYICSVKLLNNDYS